MTITSRLFEAFLKCPTKCFLRSLNETATGNEYADWVRTQQACYRSDGIQSLRQGVTPDERITGPLHANYGKPASWRLAIDCLASAQNLESTIHAVEQVPSEARGKAGRLIPIRFIFSNRLSKDDRMLVAFDALVLSEMLGREVGLGKIIHGADRATLKVKTGGLASTVRKLTERISALLSANSLPDLVLNRHCTECEFQNRCRQKAIETDDLSLLSGISENERNSHRSKGIFTVAQLSYTFRPRKTPKRAQNPAKPRYMALQARAIRENTVYIHGSPQLPDSKTLVYLDIEGLPDSESYYLIGALVVSEGGETFHSFWANQKPDEAAIFAQFAEAMGELPDSRILHFGDYESIALKRMRKRLPECLRPKINAILERTTNVLSTIHPHLYFPTYANSLKDIGRFLRFQRADEIATGLQTIVWRKSWEARQAAATKARLLQYNQDDCRALKHVFEFIRRLTSPEFATASVSQISVKTTQSEDLPKTRPRWEMFGPREYASEDLRRVAKCAYFDYQRERVYVRSHPHFKVVNKRRRKFSRASIRVNKVQAIESQRCPQCQSRKIEKRKQMSHDVIDLKFFNGGMKRWITRIVSWRYRCLKCDHGFSSEKRPPRPVKYGHGLYSWCVYANVARGMNMLQVEKSLGDSFGLVVPSCEAYRSKSYVAELYQFLYREIFRGILASPVIHIDETTVRLRKQTGYVWVMASMDKVHYFYRPSREGSFLQEMLGSFSGVLVSDFYTAYDSLPHEQQKCLVHLLRDIDDDLLRNPLDSEFKNMGHDFAALLRTIIETVDRYGLKSRHLHKHKRAATRFLDSVGSADFSSQLALKYQKRFQKSGEKMFTFLDHDGVPWNNTNAEHAIKRFAKYRRHADGRLTERSLQEYLVLTSVLETCEFNNVNALQFLLSKQTTLEGLLEVVGRRAKTSEPCKSTANPNKGPFGNPTGLRS
jgi:predicted RecB family nuclease